VPDAISSPQKDSSEFPVEIGLNPIIEPTKVTMALSAIVGISDRKEENTIPRHPRDAIIKACQVP
jgi:hypothetical protein